MKTYDFVDILFNEFRRVRFNDKWGFININGDEICECKYDWIYNFYNGYAFVYLKPHYGFINVNGNEVIECKYYYIPACMMIEKYKSKLNRIEKLKTLV